MGVRFARDYEDIMVDMTNAVPNIEGFYEFFHMEWEDWQELSDEEKKECTKTMCDDIFFALGSQSAIPIARGVVSYDNEKHVITVNSGKKLVAIIHLV